MDSSPSSAERKRQTFLPTSSAKPPTANASLKPLKLQHLASVDKSPAGITDRALSSRNSFRTPKVPEDTAAGFLGRRKTTLGTIGEEEKSGIARSDEDSDWEDLTATSFGSVERTISSGTSISATIENSSASDADCSKTTSFTRIMDPKVAYRWIVCIGNQVLASDTRKSQLVSILGLKDGGAMDTIRKLLTSEEHVGKFGRRQHIAQLIEVIVHQDSFFLVKEYIPTTIHAVISCPAADLFTIREVRAIASGVTKGIYFLNYNGLQHGRIGRLNIGICEDGTIKIQGCEDCTEPATTSGVPLIKRQINQDLIKLGSMITSIVEDVNSLGSGASKINSVQLDTFCHAAKYANITEIFEIASDFLSTTSGFDKGLVEFANIASFRRWSLVPDDKPTAHSALT